LIARNAVEKRQTCMKVIALNAETNAKKVSIFTTTHLTNGGAWMVVRETMQLAALLWLE